MALGTVNSSVRLQFAVWVQERSGRWGPCKPQRQERSKGPYGTFLDFVFSLVAVRKLSIAM